MSRLTPYWQRMRAPMERAAVRLRLDRVTNRQIWIAASLSLILAAVTWHQCGITGCPNINRLASYQPNGATVLLDRTGERFANLTPVRYQVVPLRSLPAYVPQAFLAVEDKRFYRHNGVDWGRVAGAMVANVKARGVAEGFSTITMQLARNVFPRDLPQQERTLRRKLLEVRVARAIERNFKKNEILELYLNHIYFGNGAYGIEAAAQQYFRKRARDLTLSQAALLAALPKAPALYDPRRRASRAKTRRDLVLALMKQQEYISPEKAVAASKTPLKVAARSRRGAQDDGFAPYYIDTVRRMLEDRYGDLIYERRLQVHTTLDVRAQRAAEDELSKQLRSIESGELGALNGPRYTSASESDEQGTRYLQGAAVVMEVETGDVLAMVGGRDFIDSPFNRATQSQRQVGSAFKPFVFATAINGGYSPGQHLVDEPISFPLARGDVYEPRNYDGLFYGEISLRQTLVESRNVPTVRLADALGLENVRQTAVRAGISGDMPLHPSMPLGTVVSNPLELARAYAVFPGLGVQPDPRFISSVVNEDGDTIWSIVAVHSNSALDPRVAYVVTDMLRDAVDHGTGAGVRSAGFYGASAGKTGTTNEGTDAWFVGYTPDLVGAVWVGFDQRRAITGNASGGRLAAPVWGRIMRRVYANRADPGEFEVPAGIVHRMIDPESGLVLQDGCWPTYEDPVREVFLDTQEPQTICPHYGSGIGDWVAGIWRRLQGHRDLQVVIPDTSTDEGEVQRRADEMRRARERQRKGNWPRN